MNLALLRVFGILIAVHELNRLVRLLLQVTMGDEGESFTDIAPMILASVAIILVGIIVFAKKSAKLLRVFSAIMIIVSIVGGINFARVYLGLQYSPGVGFLLQRLADHFINMFMVVYFVSLFMGNMKTQEGSHVNLSLLRFCAVVFLVDGFGFLVHIGYDHSVPVVIMTAASIAAGVVALAKNNTLVLKAFAVCSILWLLWTHIEFVRTNMFGAYHVANAIVGIVFSAHLVVCITTFFIDVEESKFYLQKLKALFFKWKNLT
ncbi:MAG: hypothetical protein IJ177_07185 [Fibrobacter sp.]|uniref:hypothetical protein n=1 Tax=Fibrobacter sp. TaxID=35828 RepID=UPI0025BE835A|nr:hypothetical protein [Fibrobacter sp.]MBQ9225958.1 hypothetical protein [Fibrobacter sp.]